MILTTFRAFFHIEDPNALLLKHVHDGVYQKRDKDVVRGVGECKVECEIGLYEGFGIIYGEIHRLNGGLHGLDIAFLCSFGS